MPPDGPTNTPSTLPYSGKGTVTRLGNYELLDQLGEGGMGVVFKAQQIGLDRLVAVKVMNPLAVPSGHEATARKRFLNEANAMARLHHPYIIPIYEVGEHMGVCYFSMRLIPEGSLSQQIDRFTKNLMLVAYLTARVARALGHAHQNGVIHRDIKPQNILVEAGDQPSVTDFGLAKLASADMELTQTGQILGTPQYMSPEQARGDSKHVKEPADIFSLGVVLYRLLSGQLPFDGTTRYEIVRQILEHTPERPSIINPEVDDDLEFICLKCLEKDARRRYTSGEHLADDLENWAHEYGGRQSLREMAQMREPDLPERLHERNEFWRRVKRGAWRRSAERAALAANTAAEKAPAQSAVACLLAKLEALFTKGLALRRRVPLIRVVLADDHPIVISGIRAELQKISGVQVVGEACDGNEALELVRTLQPNVVFMDISMPELNGLVATARINKEFPHIRVIILSRHEREEYYWQALRAGASGYMLKKDAVRELATALQRVTDGEVFLSRGISGRLGKTLALKPVTPQQSPVQQLTERQQQILHLIAEGQTTKEIALKLRLSPKTVEYHRAQLMQRLDVHDAIGLIRYAMKEGLVECES